MADIKISELTAVSSLNNDDLVEVSQVNALAPSGYTSLKATMRDIGSKVNKDIEYTTDLADFEDKTALGAIKETAKGKNVADEYDDTQTYDKGDVVIYKNTLYICTTNNTTGTWDATKWTATTVQSLIGSLSTLTTTDKSSIVGAVNEVNANKPTNTNTNPMFKRLVCSDISVTISANGSKQIIGNDIGLSPSGYTPVAVCAMYTNLSNSCAFTSFDAKYVTGLGTFCYIKNLTASSVTGVVNFTILFARNDVFAQS